MQRILRLLAVLLLLTHGLSGLRSPKKKKENIIGLISVCKSKDTLAMGKLISQRFELMFKIALSHFFDYTEIDVCEDQRLLVAALDSLLLDTKWYDEDNQLTIRGIIAFMPEDMLRLTVSYLSYTDIKLFPMFTVSDSNHAWFDKFDNFIPVFDLLAETIVVKLIKQFHWKHAAIIDIVAKPSAKKLRIKDIQRELPSRCLDYRAVNVTDLGKPKMNETFELLKKDEGVKVVIVKGHVAAKFMTEAQKYGVDKYWVLLTRFKGDNETVAEFISISRQREGHFQHENIAYHNDTLCNGDYIKFIKQTTSAFLCEKFKTKHNGYQLKHFNHAFNNLIPKQILKIKLILDPPIGKSYNDNPDIYQFYDKETHRINEIKNIPITDRILKLGAGHCHICLRCGELCERVGIRQVKPVKYDNSFSIGCLTCKKHLVVADSLGTCSTCPPPTIPNKNQTACYNPIVYEEILVACYVLNGIGALTCFFIIFIYFKYKETPVVRSSDFTPTIIQLAMCIVMFIALPSLITFKLDWFICTARPCVIGLLLVAIVSIVVCKAEKILIIFYTKRRLTKKDISDIQMRQLCIFGFLLIVDLILLPTAFRLPANMSTKAYPTESTEAYVMEYCDSDDHFDAQIIYCITLLLLAIAQGYRGRKLPSNYNEGNSIVAGAASTICAFSFMIWAINSYKHQYERLSVIWLTLCVSIFFLVVSLYGPKIYIILFQPHKNTKKHLLNTMMMDSNAKRVVSALLPKKTDPAGKRESLHRLLPNSVKRKDINAEHSV